MPVIIFFAKRLVLKQPLEFHRQVAILHTQTPSAFNFITDNGLIPCPFRNSNGCYNTSDLAKKIITGMISLSFFIFQKIKIVSVSK